MNGDALCNCTRIFLSIVFGFLLNKFASNSTKNFSATINI